VAFGQKGPLLEIFTPFDERGSIALFMTSAASRIRYAIFQWARVSAMWADGQWHGVRLDSHKRGAAYHGYDPRTSFSCKGRAALAGLRQVTIGHHHDLTSFASE